MSVIFYLLFVIIHVQILQQKYQEVQKKLYISATERPITSFREQNTPTYNSHRFIHNKLAYNKVSSIYCNFPGVT